MNSLAALELSEYRMDLNTDFETNSDSEARSPLRSAAFESPVDAILIANLETGAVECNDRFLKLWGLQDAAPRSTLGGLLRFIARQLRNECDTGLLDPASPLTGEPELFYLPLKDGRVIEFYAQDVETPSSTDTRRYNFRDVTRQQQIQAACQRTIEKLKQENRAKSDFTAIVSHEIKTPLTAIKESIEIVLEGIDGPVTSDQRDTLGITKNNIDRLTKLISNVLDYERVDSGKLEIKCRETNLSQLVSETLSLMKLAVRKKGIALGYNAAKKPVSAFCDADKLKQVLINLIDNSIKYTNAGGQISVGLWEEHASFCISVRDTGIGIKMTEQDQIFKMFEQSSSSQVNKVDSPSAGVGLTVCKKIIEEHCGTIEVISQPGQGSEFVIRLPKKMI